MAKGKKITILTADEKAELDRKARGRAIFKETVSNGQYKAKVHENKRRKAEKARRKDEDRKAKREYL